MLEDIKDVIEKKRDLEIKNMEGVIVVSIAFCGVYLYMWCASYI